MVLLQSLNQSLVNPLIWPKALYLYYSAIVPEAERMRNGLTPSEQVFSQLSPLIAGGREVVGGLLFEQDDSDYTDAVVSTFAEAVLASEEVGQLRLEERLRRYLLGTDTQLWAAHVGNTNPWPSNTLESMVYQLSGRGIYVRDIVRAWFGEMHGNVWGVAASRITDMMVGRKVLSKEVRKVPKRSLLLTWHQTKTHYSLVDEGPARTVNWGRDDWLIAKSRKNRPGVCNLLLEDIEQGFRDKEGAEG